MIACAVVTTGLLIRREFIRPTSVSANPTRFEQQTDWRTYDVGGNRIGPPRAPVVMVEFSDYQCPACKVFEERLRKARERFPQFTVLYRHLPLRNHRFAFDAAVASECAAAQGRFERMHTALFEIQDSLGVVPWSVIASRASVPNLTGFARCLSDSTIAANVRRDLAAATQLGARGTPTALINGVRFSGSIPQDVLDSLVSNALNDTVALRR